MTVGEKPRIFKTDARAIELSEIDATCTYETIMAHAKDAGKCLVYWQSADRVDFGFFNGENFFFYDYEKPQWRHLQELRIFNDAFELHVWKSSEDFFCRVIHGEREFQGEESETDDIIMDCLEQKVKLWGTKAKVEGDWTKVFEDRGMTLAFPFLLKSESYEAGMNVFLQERRYLLEDESGCIYFSDRRFCSIWTMTENKNKLMKMEVDSICLGEK